MIGYEGGDSASVMGPPSLLSLRQFGRHRTPVDAFVHRTDARPNSGSHFRRRVHFSAAF